MPHVKMAKKSTDTDMTPFVDIAFLILSFFIMATKFKPPEPVPIKTPGSVSSDILKEDNAMLITIDKDSKVYINITAKKEPARLTEIIKGINTSRSLGLSRSRNAEFQESTNYRCSFSAAQRLLGSVSG